MILTKRSERAAYWRKVYEEQKSCSSSANKFCSERGIKYSTYIGWRRRFELEGVEVPATAAKFKELYPPPYSEPTATTWSYRIQLSNGRELYCSDNFEAVKVSALIRVLE